MFLDHLKGLHTLAQGKENKQTVMGRTFGGLSNVVCHDYGRLGALDTEIKFIQSLFTSFVYLTQTKCKFENLCKTMRNAFWTRIMSYDVSRR